MIQQGQQKPFPGSNVSGTRSVAEIAGDPRQDEKLTREGFIRSVIAVNRRHVTYYRSRLESPAKQHGPARCTRETWADWASGAERWEA